VTRAPSGAVASARPHGPDAVRTALVDAAARLFAERGPDRVSVKQIAAAAGVNHGLVHHYFGSKDALLSAVLASLSEQVAAELASGAPADVIAANGGATERHNRIAAFLILQGRDPAALKGSFPVFDTLVASLRGQGLSPADARLRTAQVVAQVIGWQLFESFLIDGAGLPRRAGTRRRAIDDAVGRLLRPDT
jgi:AcrR family transcriptional regulator